MPQSFCTINIINQREFMSIFCALFKIFANRSYHAGKMLLSAAFVLAYFRLTKGLVKLLEPETIVVSFLHLMVFIFKAFVNR